MRWSSGTPSSPSSCLTAWLTVGCDAKAALAAREKPPCRTTSTNILSRRRLSSIRIWHVLYSFNSLPLWLARGQNRRRNEPRPPDPRTGGAGRIGGLPQLARRSGGSADDRALGRHGARLAPGLARRACRPRLPCA